MEALLQGHVTLNLGGTKTEMLWLKCPRFLLPNSLGMNHDDDHTSCAGRSHIMSGEWVKGRNPSDLSWSACSREDLENFLR